MSAYDDRNERYPQQPQPQGNGCGKIFLILLAIGGFLSLMLCCAGGIFVYWVSQQFSITVDATKIREMTGQIVEITIPAELEPKFGGEIKKINMRGVFYADEKANEEQALILLGFPENAKQADKESTLNQTKQNKNLKIEKTEEKMFKVRGEEKKFIVQTGKDDNDKEMKQVIGEFKGKTDQVLFMLIGVPDKITDEKLQGILDTVK